MSRQEMVDKKLYESACYSKIIRVIGFFLIVAGIWLFFSPIVNLLGYIPLVGGFLSKTVGILIFVAAVIIAIPLFLVAISLAWLCFHPKVGLIIIGIALVILGVILALNFGLGGGG